MTARVAWSIFSVVLATGTLIARAPAQGQGFTPGSEPRTRHARVKRLRATVDTDVVLDEILLQQDDAGRRRLIMGGPIEKGIRERLFWLADPASGQYHVLRLTSDHASDAKRIQKAYRKFGADVSDQDVGDMLRTDSGVQDRRIRRLRDKVAGQPAPQAGLKPQRPESTRSGYRMLRVSDSAGLKGLTSKEPQDCGDEIVRPRLKTVQWVQSCAGYGYADIQTWEPARYVFNVDHLNETWTEAWWSRYDYAIYNLQPYGFCWANPTTFAGTHWYTAYCQPHGSFYGNGFDSNWTGQYLNVDFLPVVFNIQGAYTPVVVTSTASVQYVNGFANWGAQYYEDGSYIAQYVNNWFLSGIITGDAYEYSCQWNCAPDGQMLQDCTNSNGNWDYNSCQCVPSSASPILVDLEDGRLKLTDAQNGVSFDLRADGQPVPTAWTQAGSKTAFLVLDRNHNGTIDDGSELFGNVTLQPLRAQKRSGKNAPNGFLALGVFDDPSNGGNGDGTISEDDAIYSSLRMWIDANHDGISQPEELKSLSDSGVRSISLHYVVGKKTDEFGNVYRYRSHALMDRDIFDSGSIERRAIDVFLKIALQ